MMKPMMKNMAMSIGCLMMAGMLGCVYAPEDEFGLGYPVAESPQYALAPNTRWTCLRYGIDDVFGPRSDVWIYMDSHRILFTKKPLGAERPTVVKDHIATADEWRWMVRQLKKAGVSRWKQSYEPDGVEVLDGVAWHLEFLDGSNVVGKVFGYNDWPKSFKDFQPILDAFGVTRRGSSLVSPMVTEEKTASPR